MCLCAVQKMGTMDAELLHHLFLAFHHLDGKRIITRRASPGIDGALAALDDILGVKPDDLHARLGEFGNVFAICRDQILTQRNRNLTRSHFQRHALLLVQPVIGGGIGNTGCGGAGPVNTGQQQLARHLLNPLLILGAGIAPVGNVDQAAVKG